MKHLKQIGKMGIFFVACAVVFGFFGEETSSAPTTETECKAITPNPGECRDDIGNNSCAVGMKHAYGTCGSGKICCISSGSVGSKCESSGRDGSCKEAGKCDVATEDDLGTGKDCQKGAPSLPDLTCCSLKSSSPNPDVTCGKLQCGDGSVTGTCMPTSPGCGDLQQYGSCSSNVQGGSVCCIPKNCTPTTTASSPSGSTAALNYTPLENLPGFENLEKREIEGCGSNMFCKYFKALYFLALWIVGISALFMLVVGGFLYLSSAGNTSLLGTAKKTIYGALIGLIIALISWLLLDTINSDLTNLKLSGLSGAVGTNTNGGATSGNEGKTPPAGSVESCKSMKTQVSTSQCDDASANLLGALQCMNQELGGRMTLSSISDKNGFKGCQDSWTDAGCAHAQNSCHYGGKGKYSKSCAADISRSASGAASDAEFRAAAKKCNVSHFDIHGSPVAHVHISTSECDCDSNLPAP